MGPIGLLAVPPVQHWPFLARAGVHTALWTALLLLLQYVLLAIVTVLRWHHLQRSAKPVKLHWARMFLEDVAGYVGWTWPLGLLAAWLNPGAPGGWVWDFSCPNLIVLGYYAQATLMAYDAYSYFLHRWMHSNKTAFRLMHAKHHEHRASLDVTTSGYMSFFEGAFSGALPVLALYGLGLATGNWWFTLAGIWNSMHIVIAGHCGHKMTLGDQRDLPLLLLNPFALWYETTPVHATPMEHEDHHSFPTRNFAFFYTHLDDIHNTSRHPVPPCSLLVLCAHAVWQALFFGSVHLLFTHFQAYTAAYLFAYVLCSPARASAVAECLRLPDLTRRLFGWVMDAYRADNCITFEQPGAPGAFDAAAAAAATAKGQHKTAPVFVFACHPTGMLSRAAFCTFAARGWASPVSKLAEVRLAVGSQLMRVPLPFVREALLACGCIPADAAAMRGALRAGCSVAVTPGGWREQGHVGSYNLVLQRRTGFVALAQEAGAHLVPVLCLGEQDLTGPREPGYRWVKWLQSQRPHPVRVVFGKPLVARKGETVEQLHSRYVKALLQLGQQHSVKLAVVE